MQAGNQIIDEMKGKLYVTISPSDIYEDGVAIPQIDVQDPGTTGEEESMVVSMTGTGIRFFIECVREKITESNLRRFAFVGCDAKRQRVFVWAAKRAGIFAGFKADGFGVIYAICELKQKEDK